MAVVNPNRWSVSTRTEAQIELVLLPFQFLIVLKFLFLTVLLNLYNGLRSHSLHPIDEER